MKFEFATTQRIIFGAGTLQQAPAVAKTMGRRGLLVTGQNLERSAPLVAHFQKAGTEFTRFQVPNEPTLDLIRQGIELAKRDRCDWVVACGGGSALDAGKAISALLTNPGDLLEYVEMIGKAKPLEKAAAPFLAIPTTAGTGSEVTRNAVLTSPEHRAKVSLRHPLMLPQVALVDPELMCSLSPELTASTGLDALTQLIEPMVCTRANPVTDGFCREGLPRAARSLRRACEEPNHIAAREDMALASLLGGMALANAGLGAVHGFASPIGGMFPAPHGAVCAALLPHVMEVNLSRLEAAAGSDTALKRFDEVARLLLGRSSATAKEGVRWVTDLCRELRVPPLREFGIKREHLAAIVEWAAGTNSMKVNPAPLTKEDLTTILARAI